MIGVAPVEIAHHGRRGLDAGGLVRAQQRGQVVPQDGVEGTAEKVGDVGADLPDLELGLANHGEHAARLDAARNVDRLARTVVEIDGRTDGNQIVDRTVAVGHAAGCAVYDLRGITEGVGADDPEIGLIQFKVGTGGEAVAYVGEWDYAINRPLYLAFNLYLSRR